MHRPWRLSRLRLLSGRPDQTEDPHHLPEANELDPVLQMRIARARPLVDRHQAYLRHLTAAVCIYNQCAPISGLGKLEPEVRSYGLVTIEAGSFKLSMAVQCYTSRS
jgi:hypothetical protein